MGQLWGGPGRQLAAFPPANTSSPAQKSKGQSLDEGSPGRMGSRQPIFKSIIFPYVHLFIGWFFFMNDVPFVTWMTCSFNKINEQPGENK
jgi:hypothetical protein